MTYEYNIRKKAMKFITKQDKKQQERIMSAKSNTVTLIDVTNADNRGQIYK